MRRATRWPSRSRAWLAPCSGADILDGLAEQARSVGVEPWSADFDDAARLLGYHYSRAWNAYVSREDLAVAERHPLAHMH